ncbi:hypothetical protein ACFLU6_09390 [Acidobacteriota bacterium]
MSRVRSKKRDIEMVFKLIEKKVIVIITGSIVSIIAAILVGRLIIVEKMPFEKLGKTTKVHWMFHGEPFYKIIRDEKEYNKIRKEIISIPKIDFESQCLVAVWASRQYEYWDSQIVKVDKNRLTGNVTINIRVVQRCENYLEKIGFTKRDRAHSFERYCLHWIALERIKQNQKINVKLQYRRAVIRKANRKGK